jgi:hypothetical protein
MADHREARRKSARGEFPDKFAALEAAGRWSLLEVSTKLQPTPIGEPEVTIRVLVYRVETSRL